MMITANTKICGLIGNPVEHSMSPAMHNAAFAASGLDFIYLPFRVKKERLEEAIGGLRGLNIHGLNVTIPHKVAVIPFLDGLDELAGKIGAVNTIVNDDGRLTGHNTDAGGFLRALTESGIEPTGKKVVVLGAGGVARAIAFTLAENGASPLIMNRKLEFGWAVGLAGQLEQAFNIKVEALELTKTNLEAALRRADILVNATSVGMSPNTDDTPVPRRLLKPEMAVFDVVYNPRKTRLLAEAGAAGAVTISGLEMLVWQGALAFEVWTGRKAPVALMREEALKALGDNED
ncbi:MAG: shikimate dehydrogenase [Dehalococcoidales bacterium]